MKAANTKPSGIQKWMVCVWILFTGDKLALTLSSSVSLRPNWPRATDNPGLGASVLWKAGDSGASAPHSFWHLPCILYWHSSSIYATVGYIAPVAFQGSFSSSEVFLSLSPFIFCPLPVPRRAKAPRIANSPFPHLSSVCRRGGKDNPESLTVSFMNYPVDGYKLQNPLVTHLFMTVTALLRSIQLKTRQNLQTFLQGKHFSTFFFSL